MLVFDELQSRDEKWLAWYTSEVASYPMGDFSILDPSFNMKTCVEPALVVSLCLLLIILKRY